MKRSRFRNGGLCLVLAAAAAAWAGPLTTSFLTPSTYSVALGQSLTVHWDAGTALAAQPIAWPSGEVNLLFIRGGTEQENRHDVKPERSQDNFVAVTIGQPGVTLIGAERPVVREVTGSDLRAFLMQNVATDKIAADVARLEADRKYRVRDITSAKTLVRAATAEPEVPSAIATSKTGLKGEIRPQFDPTMAPVGSDLPLTVYIDGDKCPGAKVQVTAVASGKTTTLIADHSGSVHFPVTDLGVWRLEFHYAEPLAHDPAADWTVNTATLTFEITKGGAQ
jgi:hypothetical protein